MMIAYVKDITNDLRTAIQLNKMGRKQDEIAEKLKLFIQLNADAKQLSNNIFVVLLNN